jgi:hypothetical protein
MINLTREEAHQVLGVLSHITPEERKVIAMLLTKLSAPEPEPVDDKELMRRVIALLPEVAVKAAEELIGKKKEWHGLTDEEYEAMAEQYVTNCYFNTLKYAKAIEAKLKEKNV